MDCSAFVASQVLKQRVLDLEIFTVFAAKPVTVARV